MIEFLCRCGHIEERHKYLDDILPNTKHIPLCSGCRPTFDHPYEFKSDNLKYLEQLYDLRERA